MLGAAGGLAPLRDSRHRQDEGGDLEPHEHLCTAGGKGQQIVMPGLVPYAPSPASQFPAWDLCCHDVLLFELLLV